MILTIVASTLFGMLLFVIIEEPHNVTNYLYAAVVFVNIVSYASYYVKRANSK